MEGVWVEVCVVHIKEENRQQERQENESVPMRERERKKVDAIKMMKPEQELFLMQFQVLALIYCNEMTECSVSDLHN